MSTIIAIWNCTHVDVGWEEHGADERLKVFERAALQAHLVGLNDSDAAANPKCIFVAPEYAFAEKDVGAAQPAMQVTAEKSQQIVQEIRKHSGRCPDVLYVPGTIAELNESKTEAKNRCVAFRAGVAVGDFCKHGGVGEVAPNSGVTFQSGVGYGRFTIGARTYGVQICRDATQSSFVHLPGQVDVQIVIGQGVGHDAVHHQFSALQIIADFNDSSVWKMRQGQQAQVQHYRQEAITGGGTITYYKV